MTNDQGEEQVLTEKQQAYIMNQEIIHEYQGNLPSFDDIPLPKSQEGN